MLTSLRRTQTLRIALLCAVLVGFVLALALAASPQLHELIHHDDGHGEHQCLAVTLQSGGSDAAAVAPLVTQAFLAELFALVPRGESAWVESLFLSCRVLEHAPPLIS
ncbi:MAG: hypothetical protein QOE70_5899 [Chthoniobacter sp.]|jgi:hypothetical protein|nr:hypothetical protein [Chthoniobacter sp.]